MSATIASLAGAGRIGTRLARALERDGKRTVADLARLSARDLTRIPMVGPQGRAEIRRVLDEHGYPVAHLEEPPTAGDRS
jgi:hypothetical protein